MLDKATRPVVKPPTTMSGAGDNGDKRKLELIQLETRYKSSYRLVKDTEDDTVVRLAIKPSDPDFPYEIEALQLQLTIPKDYPKTACTVQVLNIGIPKGFAINLEKGYAARVDPANVTPHQTLVRQMNWLDRNMETLLQQAPAPTVRFISNNRNNATTDDGNMTSGSTAATTGPQQAPVKQFIDATSRPIPTDLNAPISTSATPSTSAIVSPSKPIENGEASSSSSAYEAPKTKVKIKTRGKRNAAQTENVTPSTKVVEQKEEEPATPKYTPVEIMKAEKRRRKEFRQIQTRFADSFKSMRTNTKDLAAALTLKITDPDFSHDQLIGNRELLIKYNVPELYPLEPCSIDVYNKKLDETRAKWITRGFSDHVANGDFSLIENLNWLNRNLDELLSRPPTTKTKEQAEADRISKAQQKDLKPPVKKVNQHPQQQQQLSVSAPVFTPQQQQQQPQQKKKTSLFDEKDDIKRNKVIVVNDPSLVVEQADEEEVEVELADSDEMDQLTDSNGNENGEGSVLNGVSQPVVRKGTEIRLTDPKLENISLFKCSLLHIMVKCARCKDTVEVENIRPDQDEDITSSTASSSTVKKVQPKKERWVACTTCTSILGIKFLGELVHQGALSIGLLQLAGCTAFDILPSAYIGTCGSCMVDMTSTIRLAPHDPPHTMSCFSCHAKMTCGLGDYKFVRIGSEGGERLKADEQQVMKLKKKKKRDDHLTIGEPLPNDGTCSHYRKSKRWFRFSCCNKLFPCDECHDIHEDHDYEMAKRHICGMCSREQTISVACVCGHEFEKAPQKGAFWEGGKGVRNKSTMSRKDPHKHKGVGKTVSKKQDRVGTAGKERHQNDS